MALTTAQKYRILRQLGWPAATLTPTSMSYSKIISDRLDLFPADAEADLIELSDRIEELDEKLEGSLSRANIKRFDDIEFFGNEPLELRKERRRVLREMASTLDLAMGPGVSGSGISVEV